MLYKDASVKSTGLPKPRRRLCTDLQILKLLTLLKKDSNFQRKCAKRSLCRFFSIVVASARQNGTTTASSPRKPPSATTCCPENKRLFTFRPTLKIGTHNYNCGAGIQQSGHPDHQHFESGGRTPSMNVDNAFRFHVYPTDAPKKTMVSLPEKLEDLKVRKQTKGGPVELVRIKRALTSNSRLLGTRKSVQTVMDEWSWGKQA